MPGLRRQRRGLQRGGRHGSAWGRKVVALDTLVAVVADHMWAAKQGLAALKVTWREGPNTSISPEDLWSDLAKASERRGVDAETLGDAVAAMEDGDVIEAVYELPLLAHAALEPMNCTVHVKPDSCEIWGGTQVITKALAIAAKESGLPTGKITIHNQLIGGAFGRRLEEDGVGMAVSIARHYDGPVKVIWTREEDMQHDMYRPLYRNRMTARLEHGRPVA